MALTGITIDEAAVGEGAASIVRAAERSQRNSLLDSVREPSQPVLPAFLVFYFFIFFLWERREVGQTFHQPTLDDVQFDDGLGGSDGAQQLANMKARMALRAAITEATKVRSKVVCGGWRQSLQHSLLALQ